jgi:hypothetical protein
MHHSCQGRISAPRQHGRELAAYDERELIAEGFDHSVDRGVKGVAY